jgi:hypothetical protein
MLRAELAALLREAGHDVVRAEETGQARADDALILQRAVHEDRTLVTIDHHFGDWGVLPLSSTVYLTGESQKEWPLPQSFDLQRYSSRRAGADEMSVL